MVDPEKLEPEMDCHGMRCIPRNDRNRNSEPMQQ